MFFDHTLALTIIGAGLGFFIGGLPRHAATGAVLAITTVAPMTWWMKTHARLNAQHRSNNVFYLNDTTKEEVDRIRHEDAVEALGFEMRAVPGYGIYNQQDPRHV